MGARRRRTPYLTHHPNGTRTSFVYDAAGRKTQTVHRKSDGSILSKEALTLDAAGRQLTRTNEFGDVTSFTYDAAGQLLAEHTNGPIAHAVSFTYDPVGNRVKKTDDDGDVTLYVHDDADRMTSASDADGTTTHTHDAAGNLLATETPLGDITTNTWDAEHQITCVELPSGDRHTYTWNCDRIRSAKEDPLGVRTSYVWDKYNDLLELDELGSAEAEYIHAPEEYGKLLLQYRDADPEPAVHHYDAQGSTLALTDDLQVVTDRWTYRAFGETNHTDGSHANPYQWVGERGYRADSETGRHHLRRRDYDANQGRFLSKDPTGFEAGDENLYRHVGNSAPNAIDPSGLVEFPSNYPTTYLGDKIHVLSTLNTKYDDYCGYRDLGITTPKRTSAPYEVVYSGTHKFDGVGKFFFEPLGHIRWGAGNWKLNNVLRHITPAGGKIGTARAGSFMPVSGAKILAEFKRLHGALEVHDKTGPEIEHSIDAWWGRQNGVTSVRWTGPVSVLDVWGQQAKQFAEKLKSVACTQLDRFFPDYKVCETIEKLAGSCQGAAHKGVEASAALIDLLFFGSNEHLEKLGQGAKAGFDNFKEQIFGKLGTAFGKLLEQERDFGPVLEALAGKTGDGDMNWQAVLGALAEYFGYTFEDVKQEVTDRLPGADGVLLLFSFRVPKVCLSCW